MPGQIDQIIDVEGSISAINKVADRLVNLDGLIGDVSRQTIVLKVNIEGADTLAQINDGIQKLNVATNQLTQVQQENKDAVSQLNTVQNAFNGITDKSISTLVDQKQELAQTTAQLKDYKKTISESSTITDGMVEHVEMLTKNELELKIAVAATTSEIKSKIKESNAAIGSIDNLSQRLFQLKERYRALSAEQRNAANTGGVLLKEIQALDSEIKILDATIGNNQRKIGEYERALLKTGSATGTLASETKLFGVTMDQAEKKIGMMAFRMVAMQILFVPIIAGISALVEWFGKLSDSEQSAQERLQKYTDGIKELREKIHGLSNSIDIDSQKEAEKDNLLIRVILSKTASIAAVVNAYQELHGRHPTIIADLTEEQNKHKESIKLNDDQIASIKKLADVRKYEAEIKNRSEILDASITTSKTAKQKIDLLQKYVDPETQININSYNQTVGTIVRRIENEQSKPISEAEFNKKYAARIASGEFGKRGAAVDELRSTGSGTLSERDWKNMELGSPRARGKINNDAIAKTMIGLQNEYNLALKAENEQRIKIQQSEENLLNLSHLPKDAKEKKAPKDNAKELNAELEREQKQHEINMLGIKQDYVNKNNLYPDAEAMHRKTMDDAELQESKDHWEKMTLIITSYHGKVGESEAKYQERLLQQSADLKKIELATSEDEKASAEALKKIHDDANKKLDEEIEKWNKLSAEIRAIDAQIDNIKAKAKTDHDAVKGINPILAGLGIEGLDHTDIDKRKQDIAAAANRIDVANNHLSDESGKDLPDPHKILAIQKEITTENLNLAQLEADQQAAIDNKTLEAKKRIGEETVQLAQQTFEAIKTIRDNAFAAEQQQLQIEQQQLQTQSQQKIAAINATAGFQITKENQIAKVVAQTTAQQNAIQAEQNQLALKKAKADKQAAEAGIILNTALALAKVLPQYADPLTLPFAIAETALITAIGAAQYAAAASTPLPQFFTGGDVTTPIISAAERGRELGRTPSGDMLLFPEQGAYKVPIGTHIYNNNETERIIRYSVNSMGRLETMPVVNNLWDDRKLVDRLDTMIEQNMYRAPVVIKTTVIVKGNRRFPHSN